ncbi:Streptomycin 3''-kinase [Cupriavidus phytorum]|uniref:Streptomycin 3''-kinase n=2 Tax=Cupriavidus TaxID=106589 RepID=A0A976A6U7_9BURK|nr:MULTISPECIES: aminoglycoside phosphotransferase family protein [Cupriavidus]PZX33984.1 streptomycin 6-kinase [Cupriavidus alkaliphilus]SOY65509.1 Streptomycin 3''-kinase [Cupriavidus taiwanensis]
MLPKTIAIALDNYLRQWSLVPAAEPFLTPTSCLQPVSYRGQPAMLKIAMCEEERRGNAVMAWWNGSGAAARILARCDDAVVMERAESAGSLADLARTGRDDDAMRIACAVLGRLHAHTAPDQPPVVSLHDWFAPLTNPSWPRGNILWLAALVAKKLLSAPALDPVVLHGDMHHGNILHFGTQGWLAIDPKGLVGDRVFDYANLLCNPSRRIAVDRFHERIGTLVEAARLDRHRLLQWTLAWSCLSALWMMEDGLAPETPLAIAALAATELGLL